MVKVISRKLVALGDGGCGKTSLLTVFKEGYFPTTYEPTVFENHVEIITLDNQTIELSLWDTAGQEDFDRLRSLCYAETDVVLMCFSVDRHESLENIETKWISEVRQNCPKADIVLAALKCDLREDNSRREKSQQPVLYDEGLAVAKKIKAKRYIESSAKLNRGVIETIHACAQIAAGIDTPGTHSRLLRRLTKCTIL